MDISLDNFNHFFLGGGFKKQLGVSQFVFLVFGIDDKGRGIFLGSVKWFHHDTSFGHAPFLFMVD